jgi:hypothetical protein
VSDDQPRAFVVEGQGRRGWRGDVEAVDVDAAILVFQMTLGVDFLGKKVKVGIFIEKMRILFSGCPPCFVK